MDRGYFQVYRSDFPSANKKGWAPRYRVVWWLATGETVQSEEHLHHLDRDRTNDRIENLERLTRSEHIRVHRTKPNVSCTCVGCGSTFHLAQWHLNAGEGIYCSSQCYHRRIVSAETRQRTSESMKLACKQGRAGNNMPSGENNPNAKLTDRQAADIRSSSETYVQLAHRYGVHPSTIWAVKRGASHAV